MKINRMTMALLLIGVACGLVLVKVGGERLEQRVRQLEKWRRYPARTPLEARGAGTAVSEPQVFAASSLDRIFPDGMTLVQPAFSESAQVSLARHEFESFQIVVKAGQAPLESVELEIPALTRDDGNVAPQPLEVSWFTVGFVPTRKPYYPVKYVGPWPDPLLPGQKTRIEAGATQPFWVRVYAPVNTPAGLYRGKVVIKAEGLVPVEVPLAVRVYGFTLPKESRLKTAFDFYEHITKLRYPRLDHESEATYQARLQDLNDQYLLALLSYRLNPVLNIDPSSEADLGRVDRYRVAGLNNFSIGRRGGTFNNNWPQSDEKIEDLLTLYRTYGEILKLNRFLPYTYIYTWDEGEIGKPVVAKICSMIHRAYPGLKNMVCYHGIWDPQKHPDWGRDIDIWTVQIDSFKEAKIRNLQKMGMETWVYISGPSGYGSPNLAIDFDSIDYRIMPWLCWKFDLKGFLYWCVNWWPNVDPFKNAKNTKWEQNGNGLLFYPGPEGPWPSLRLEIVRDGMEDYEYIQSLMSRLTMLKDLKAQEKYGSFWTDSLRLLTVDETIAAGMTHFVKDGEVLKERRNAIAEKIEEFDRTILPEIQTNP